MGRKKLYHTEEAKAEARRRNRMHWYDRNRKKILKEYKSRQSESSGLPTSKVKPSAQPVAPTTKPRVSKTNTIREGGTKGRTNDNEENATPAPQLLLGRVHRQNRLLGEYMRTSPETFCLRVAEEVGVSSKDNQIEVIKSYLEKVAAFIEGARPHIRTLYYRYGISAEWKEAKNVQNTMSMVMQYLDEIHHRTETGDLTDALSLGLLSFQE